MIHILGDYWAKPTSMGFDLVKKKKEKDKNGNDMYNTIGYCGNIEEVIWVAYRHISEERCSERTMELKEAIQIMKETKEMIQKALGDLN